MHVAAEEAWMLEFQIQFQIVSPFFWITLTLNILSQNGNSTSVQSTLAAIS